MSKSESIWEDELIVLITGILKYLSSLSTTQELKEVLVDIISHPCWEIPRLTLWQISRDIYHGRKIETKSWIEQLASHTTPEIRDFGCFLKELSNMSEYTRLEDLTDTITGASSLLLPDEYDEDAKANPLQISMMSGEQKTYISPLYTHFFGQLSNNSITNTEQYQKKSRSLANITKLI
jgi:hypothetical protein